MMRTLGVLAALLVAAKAGHDLAVNARRREDEDNSRDARLDHLAGHVADLLCERDERQEAGGAAVLSLERMEALGRAASDGYADALATDRDGRDLMIRWDSMGRDERRQWVAAVAAVVEKLRGGARP